jgi:hypothetical protein
VSLDCEAKSSINLAAHDPDGRTEVLKVVARLLVTDEAREFVEVTETETAEAEADADADADLDPDADDARLLTVDAKELEEEPGHFPYSGLQPVPQ